MRELLIFFYLSSEFIILLFWLPTLVRCNKDQWSKLKQTKIPLILLLTISLLAQLYLVVMQNNNSHESPGAIIIAGEFLVKGGFLFVLVTRILVSVSIVDMNASKFTKADKLISWATLISILGFFMRSWSVFLV
jgi:hypothetical protein